MLVEHRIQVLNQLFGIQPRGVSAEYWMMADNNNPVFLLNSEDTIDKMYLFLSSCKGIFLSGLPNPSTREYVSSIMSLMLTSFLVLTRV